MLKFFLWILKEKCYGFVFLLNTLCSIL